MRLRRLRYKSVQRGALVGFVLGVLIMGGYSLAGSVFCTGVRSCPGSWEPYAIIFVAGVAVFTLVFGLVTLAIRSIYVRHYKDQI